MMQLSALNGSSSGSLGDINDIPIIGDALNYIQGKAQAGAESAIPTIQAAIQPYIVASLLFGIGGFVMGMAAFLSVRRLERGHSA